MGYLIAVVVIICSVIGYHVYMYNDCKAVGHSTFYCVMMSGK